MKNNSVHIVSFDVPYPPNYGGVIDVFYKIKALKEAGVKVILHCFEYGRKRQNTLKEYCETIYYYERKTNPGQIFTPQPYIVKSRENKQLLNDLLKDDFPILFEGLHTCAFLNNPELKNRKKAVRTHNIEHNYYNGLADAEKSQFKKGYLRLESRKLERFEKILHFADQIFAISHNDQQYLTKHYKNVAHLPAFNGLKLNEESIGMGEPFALYHGNLSVAENVKAAAYLVEKVFDDLDFNLIVAGNGAPEYLEKLISRNKNVTLKKDIATEEIFALIRRAQINILPTFQPTGIKLKLLAALYLGRHCLVNDFMVANTGLEKCCVVANTAKKMKKSVQELILKPFSQDESAIRKKSLTAFDDANSVKKILGWLNQ